MKKLILGPDEIKKETHKQYSEFYYRPHPDEMEAIKRAGKNFAWSRYCEANLTPYGAIFIDADSLVGILREESDTLTVLGQCALRQLITDLNGVVGYTVVYHTILPGATDQEARDYANGIDWGGEEREEGFVLFWDTYIDTVNGVDIWYSAGSDHYYFTEDVYEPYEWRRTLQS